MSLAEFYQKQCTDKLKENAALLLAKLSDPSSLVNINVSGALADAAAGGMGGLQDFATTYLKDNADSLALEALKATGLENSVLEGLNLFYNMLAQAMAAFNDLILIFLQQQAKTLQKSLDKKIAINQDLKPRLIALINSLNAMSKGDPVFDAYLKKLRAALVLLDTGRGEIQNVRDTLSVTSQFQPKLFRKGKNDVLKAVAQIKPPTDSEKIIITEQKDGQLNKSEPNVLRSGKAPGAAEFAAVRASDVVIVLASTGGTHTLAGTYTVVAKLSDVALKLSGNVFDTTKTDAVDAVVGVHFYVKTIVKGTGAALKSQLINSFDLPTEPQQIENIMGLPKQMKDIIVAAKDYSVTSTRTNLLIVLYLAGMQNLVTGMPAVMKKFVLSLFDRLLVKLKGTVRDMANVLNGAPTNIGGPGRGFTPQPLSVSVHAFKWAMDLNLTVESMKLIPTSILVIEKQGDGHVGFDPRRLLSGKGTSSTEFAKVKVGDTLEILSGDLIIPGTYTVMALHSAREFVVDRPMHTSTAPVVSINNVEYFIETDGALDQFALSQGPVLAYENSVAAIKKLGTIQNGSAALIATQGQENSTIFEGQLLTFLLQSVPAVGSGKVRAEVISLGKALVNRCDLAIARDTEIKRDLQAFIDTPIPLIDTLNQILAGLNAMLKGLGLDKALDLFKNGDYTALLGLNGKNATYIGAALEAIALLKDCVQNDAEKGKLDDAANNLAGQKDLLNIKISFDFDFAILKNIADCLDLTNLAKLFLSKEFLCNLLAETGSLATDAFDNLEDLLTTPS